MFPVFPWTRNHINECGIFITKNIITQVRHPVDRFHFESLFQQLKKINWKGKLKKRAEMWKRKEEYQFHQHIVPVSYSRILDRVAKNDPSGPLTVNK